MCLKTTSFAMVRITVPVTFPNISAFGAFLRRESRINIENSLTESFGFVLQELSKLIERPRIQFPVEIFTSPALDSDACQVFECEDVIGHLTMVFEMQRFVFVTNCFSVRLSFLRCRLADLVPLDCKFFLRKAYFPLHFPRIFR